MTSKINASTTSGLVFSPDTSGEIELQSNGTNIASITANGVNVTSDLTVDTTTFHVDSTNNRVGIGTSSPSYTLDVNDVSRVAGLRQAFKTGLHTVDGALSNYSSTNGVYLNGNTSGWLRLNGDGTNATYMQVVGTSASTNSNTVQFYTNGSERMRIASDGKVFIGTTSYTGKVNISQSAGDWVIVENSTFSGTQYFTSYRSSGTQIGTITGNGTNVSYNTSSDYRLKNNVAPMSGSIDRLKQLKPSTWSWTTDGSHGEGFLAHEAQTVVPEAVTGTKDAMKTEEYEVTPEVLDDDGNVVTEAVMGTREVPDYQGIDQSKLVPLLTSALQESITKIENLETRIQALENA